MTHKCTGGDMASVSYSGRSLKGHVCTSVMPKSCVISAHQWYILSY